MKDRVPAGFMKVNLRVFFKKIKGNTTHHRFSKCKCIGNRRLVVLVTYNRPRKIILTQWEMFSLPVFVLVLSIKSLNFVQSFRKQDTTRQKYCGRYSFFAVHATFYATLMSHGLFYRCPCYVSGPGNI